MDQRGVFQKEQTRTFIVSCQIDVIAISLLAGGAFVEVDLVVVWMEGGFDDTNITQGRRNTAADLGGCDNIGLLVRYLRWRWGFIVYLQELCG